MTVLRLKTDAFGFAEGEQKTEDEWSEFFTDKLLQNRHYFEIVYLLPISTLYVQVGEGIIPATDRVTARAQQALNGELFDLDEIADAMMSYWQSNHDYTGDNREFKETFHAFLNIWKP